MSQRDLVAELRAAHVEAPPEVRERVRLIAAAAPAPPRRITWRRAFVVAVPIAAAIAATVVFTRPAITSRRRIQLTGNEARDRSGELRRPTAPRRRSRSRPRRPASRPTTPTLSLRVEHARDVSDGVKRALQIATSLGGYSASVRAETHGSRAVADLKLKIPVRTCSRRWRSCRSSGRSRRERVDRRQDGARMQPTARSRASRSSSRSCAHEAQTAENDRRIAALVTRIERLQRGEATTRRTAHYATVDLHLETPLVTIAAGKHGSTAPPRRGRRLDTGSGSARSTRSPRSAGAGCSPLWLAAAACGGAARTRCSSLSR